MRSVYSVCDIHVGNYSISSKTPQQHIHIIDTRHKQTCILLISMTSDLLPTRTTGRRLPSGTMRRNKGNQCEVICRAAKNDLSIPAQTVLLCSFILRRIVFISICSVHTCYQENKGNSTNTFTSQTFSMV